MDWFPAGVGLEGHKLKLQVEVSSYRDITMAKLDLNTMAPDFRLEDFHGEVFDLAQQRGLGRVLLLFIRGFA